MAKRSLIALLAILEGEIVETLLAGHHQYRPDLAYPESHSDMVGAVRGLLRMFEVKRLPLPRPLCYLCNACGGSGYCEMKPDHRKTCETCNGKGWEES